MASKIMWYDYGSQFMLDMLINFASVPTSSVLVLFTNNVSPGGTDGTGAEVNLIEAVGGGYARKTFNWAGAGLGAASNGITGGIAQVVLDDVYYTSGSASGDTQGFTGALTSVGGATPIVYGWALLLPSPPAAKTDGTAIDSTKILCADRLTNPFTPSATDSLIIKITLQASHGAIIA